MISLEHKIELPLYLFFKKLQAYDVQLNHQALSGDVYLQLVEVLAEGYGLTEASDLYGLCKRIWLKPYHNEMVFRELFDQYLQEVIADIQKANKDATTKEPSEKPLPDQNPNKETPEPKPPVNQEPKKPEATKETTDTRSKTQDKKQKTISLNFTSVTTTQNEFLETDMEAVEKDIYSKIYRLRGRYPSISPRKVQQGFRSLRIEQESYNKKQLDVSATIERVSKKGYLDRVVLNYQTARSTPINLLIDQGGSMVGFQHLVEMLKEKAQAVNSENTAVYYFRNCPVTKLFTNAEQTRSIDLAELIRNNNNTFLILSDAGAARGRYNPERIQATQQFLKTIKNRSAVWINPVPKNRWDHTSADYISELIPMFEATDIAFINAIKQLK